MKRVNGELRFSPSDLVNYVTSEFITWMDRFHLDGHGDAEPDEPSEELRLIQEKGIEHEKEFLRLLSEQGKKVLDLSGSDNPLQDTILAMCQGEEIIYQGCLERDEFGGYPDFLVRVDERSELGAWSYEVWDTKLAHHPKPYYLIQLCCYAEMLEPVLHKQPARVRVVLGKREGGELLQPEFRTDDFFYYYRSVKEAFLEQQRTFGPETPPEIPALTDLGRWTGYASRILEERDDLSLVANIRRSQIRKLHAAGIHTLSDLARREAHVPKLNDSTLERLRRQAQLQLTSRGKDKPDFELLALISPEERRGLALLPPPSTGDIFFDMEGYPLVDEGREYLFGACLWEGDTLVFRDWWAHNPAQEKRAFEEFVRWAYRRWKDHPDLHIYHYNHYEVDALRRLMGRHGVCEFEVDELLRNDVFVDLYQVLRQSIQIGEPSYSLKYVEHLYRGRRGGDVASAVESMAAYQKWLIVQDGDSPETSDILREIRDYNEQDCQSTAELAEWLRERQLETGIVWRPKPEEPKKEDKGPSGYERQHTLAEEILNEVPDELPPGDEGEKLRVQRLLGHLLEFHRRTEKPIWWRRFDRELMEEQELIDDPECLGGITRTDQSPVPVKQSYLYEYTFDPRQETKVRQDDTVRFARDWRQTAQVAAYDDAGRIVLKLGKRRAAPPDRFSIYPDEPILSKPLGEAIERLVLDWRSTGALPQALEDFLHRRRPRIAGNPSGPIVKSDDPVRGTTDAALAMEDTTLCIQGPPGSGKTYTSARVIAELLGQGCKVGITSNSHHAINVLVQEVLDVTEQNGEQPAVARAIKLEKQAEGLPDYVHRCNNAGLFTIPANLFAATAFGFCRPEACNQLDYLVIDEAGQVSVGNLVAMSACTRNLILVGDQMQLGQPIQGAHPGESGLSVLEYLLEDHATIPDDFGIFLPRTWRLHPEVCRFISGAVYEDRLTHEPHTAERVLVRNDASPVWLTLPAGLIYIPVEHEGNVYESEEEEQRIAQIVGGLLGVSHKKKDGAVDPLQPEDILVVAPYNLQVRRLTRRLGAVRVGTVDKFQGQQAPVVIFSMCASTGDSAPRGIEFLFSRNRLNVAISRAQSLAIIVAHPALVRTPCGNVDHMRLLNAYCRAVQQGETARASAI